jgi:histone deacetylase complex regulatory component SIN3
MDAQIKYYKALLNDAIQLIDLYVAEIHNRPNLMKEGFCQGEIFQTKNKEIVDRWTKIVQSGNNTTKSRWEEVVHQLDQFKADVLDCKRHPEFSRYWGCMSRCQAVLWALLNYIRYDESV